MQLFHIIIQKSVFYDKTIGNVIFPRFPAVTRTRGLELLSAQSSGLFWPPLVQGLSNDPMGKGTKGRSYSSNGATFSHCKSGSAAYSC